MKEKIDKIRSFINSQRLYTWLIIFILLINTAGVFLSMGEEALPEKKPSLFPSGEELAKRRTSIETRLTENKSLSIAVSLAAILITLAILVGLVLNIIILFLRINKIQPVPRTLSPPGVNWTMWDAAKVVILFLFFGYVLTIIESVLVPVFPSIKTQEAMRSAINTTLLDLLGVCFVLYFAIGRYKQKLTDLGISFKNFFKNIFYGLAGYIAAIPVLILILLAIMWVVTLFKYQPPPQPVLELFVQEKKTPALVYLSIFVGIFGPIAEEIFFRGFMYNAIKKEMGLAWALLLSSALFALLHAHLIGFLPIMVLGLLLAYLYEKTGSLVAPIAVHIIHNSAMILLVFLMKELYF